MTASSTSAVGPARRISAVVVSHNSAACIGRCVKSIREALDDVEIVVVDNGSSDATLSAARSAASDVRMIEIGENVGFGRACNVAALAATGSHLLLLNPDAVVAGVDNELLDALLVAQPFGLVAPALEGERERRRAESSLLAGYFTHTFEALLPREGSRRRRIHDDATSGWVSGAMLLVSREEFLELGGFDPRFFLYYEDRDLSRRYRRAGLPIRTTNTMLGRHMGGRSSADDGLRVGPVAWSLLGWIQYVAIHDSQHAAERVARAALVTLRMLRIGMYALAITRWGRARRKARQLDELLNMLAECASRNDARFCPDAVRVVRGLI